MIVSRSPIALRLNAREDLVKLVQQAITSAASDGRTIENPRAAAVAAVDALMDRGGEALVRAAEILGAKQFGPTS